jgi:hypothetical protein
VPLAQQPSIRARTIRSAEWLGSYPVPEAFASEAFASEAFASEAFAFEAFAFEAAWASEASRRRLDPSHHDRNDEDANRHLRSAGEACLDLAVEVGRLRSAEQDARTRAEQDARTRVEQDVRPRSAEQDARLR